MQITVAAKTWEPFGETSLDAFSGSLAAMSLTVSRDTQLNYTLTVVFTYCTKYARIRVFTSRDINARIRSRSRAFVIISQRCVQWEIDIGTNYDMPRSRVCGTVIEEH